MSSLRQAVDDLKATSYDIFMTPIVMVVQSMGLTTAAEVDNLVDGWVSGGYMQWVLTVKNLVDKQDMANFFEEALDNDVLFQAFLAKAATL